jgi:hypothetical protein
MKHSRLSVLPILLAVGLVAAACSPSGSLGTVPPPSSTPEPSLGSTPPDATPAPPPSSAPPASAPPSGAPSTTPEPTSADTMIVRGYFNLAGELGTEGLVPYLFEVPETQAVARAAMEKLLAGAPSQRSGFAAISSAIPAGTRLLGLSISGGIATVDLSGEFESGGGSRSTLARLGQVVYTLTQFSTVDAVAFEVDGEPVTVFGSEGLVIHGPMVRAAFEDVLPAIFVDRPASGAAIGNPARIAGTANTFEAAFQIMILDGDGRVLVDEFAMATSGSGTRGTFDETITYTVSRAQWGTLRVYEPSAQDGSPIFVRDYPVWLTPGG